MLDNIYNGCMSLGRVNMLKLVYTLFILVSCYAMSKCYLSLIEVFAANNLSLWVALQLLRNVTQQL